jgi:hypothetical protein
MLIIQINSGDKAGHYNIYPSLNHYIIIVSLFGNADLEAFFQLLFSGGLGGHRQPRQIRPSDAIRPVRIDGVRNFTKHFHLGYQAGTGC